MTLATRSTPSKPPRAASSTRRAAADGLCSTSTEPRPTDPSRWPLVRLVGKLAMIDGDLDAAERHYRAATDGFVRLDRPVKNSICLGMVADFDERAGDYPAAIQRLEAAIETNESLLGGFTGSLQAHLGWVLLHDDQRGRAETVFEGAPTRPAESAIRWCCSRPRPGWPRSIAPRASRRSRGRRLRGAGALPGGRVPPIPQSGRPHVRPASRSSGVLRGARRHRAQNGTSRNERRRCSRTPTACGSSRASSIPAFLRRSTSPGFARGRMRRAAVLAPDQGFSASAATDQRTPGW